MAFIKSKQHPRTPRRSAASPRWSTTALVSGLAIALPAAAADLATADSAAQVTHAKSLPGVHVEASASPDYRVDRVSSPKFTQPLLDTTQTVSIIGKDLIQQQGASTLAEALRNSPGVGTFYVGENGTTATGDAVYMRGFDTSSSIFVDGVRDLGAISRDVFNIEQIEVFKGPAGTDNGRTAPTGAINLVSKQATLGQALSGAVSYGSADKKRSSIDWNRQIGDRAAFRLNLMAQDSGVPGRDRVENNRWGVAPTLALGLGTPTRIYLDYLHIRQDNIPDGGVPTIGLPGYTSPDPARPQLGTAAAVNPAHFYGTDADHDRVDADMFTARIEHEISPSVLLRDTVRWGRTHETYLLTAFMLRAADLLTPDLNAPASWTVARSNPTFLDQTNTILTNQGNLTVDFQTGAVAHNLSGGIELTRERLSDAGQATSPPGSLWPAANLYAPAANVTGPAYGANGSYGHGRTDTAAAYLFDTLKFGQHWQLNAGVRVDRYTTDYTSRVACGAKNTPACGSLASGSAVPGLDAEIAGTLFNYKLGVLYKPAPNGSIYANVAVSAQPPGGSGLALSAAAGNANNPAFAPQRARTTELGAKWDLLDEKLLLTGAIYRTEVSDDVVQDPVDLQYYQVGRKRVQGIEINAVGRLTDNWAVSAGYTLMDTRVTNGPGVTESGSGDLAYTPKNAFTAWTTWHLPVGLTIGGGARHAGDMQRGTDGAIGTPAHTGAYWVVDAMADYPLGQHFSLQLNAYNLFDRRYVAAINKSGYRYTPGTPRSFMLTANFRF
ncbi:MAG: catecholate siderophore receptor Fiu [Xanthomonadaceae bacterium]|nr:catecholate siderophore receptor Fiu [Xanthomonadaceae bacterium]